MAAFAHHRPHGGYRNPWPGDRAHTFQDLLRWRRERKQVPPPPVPDYRPSVATSQFEAPWAAADVLTATWVGHATTLLQLGGVNVLTDPMWSNRASPVSWAGPTRLVPPAVSFESLPPIDVVLISHNHYDHLDRETVRRLVQRQPGAAWFVPLGLKRLVSRWGVQRVREADWWETVRADEVVVTCVPARHFSARTPWDRAQTLWAGWTIAANGWRVYFAGDTAYHPEFAAIAEQHGPFDLALLPVGAYEPRWFMGSVHMNPEDALAAYADLRAPHATAPPPAMLPIHWGTFRLTDEPVDEPPSRTRAGWIGAGLPSDALWLLAHGQTERRERHG
jgi:N-acyl-phosphatidylethanolamine-hydrolysing phospholipase D